MCEQYHKKTFNKFVIGLNFVAYEPGLGFCSSKKWPNNNNDDDAFAAIRGTQFIISLTVVVVEILVLAFATNYTFSYWRINDAQ